MSDMRQMTSKGRRIEEESFFIIDQEAGNHGLPPDQWAITRRVIHATGDFDFVHTMQFHPAAIKRGIEALKAGAHIIVDVKMIEAGLNAKRLATFGCQVHCFIDDEDVIADAKAKNSTRAAQAMRKAARLGLLSGAIVAVGNAPTALIEIMAMPQTNQGHPALVLGVPVGFVSAVESKDALLGTDIPYIVAKGRKGGSTIAVSILHALMALAAPDNTAQSTTPQEQTP